MNNSKIFSPKNLVETIDLLTKNKKIVPIAGGTSLLLNLPKDIKLLDLQQLKLNYIRSFNNGLKIGSMTTVSDVIDSPIVKGYYNGIIKEASRTIAATANRNLITIGGNIVGIHPWSVFPGLLMLLEGKVITAKGFVFKAEKLFSSIPKNILGKDIITEIQFPADKKNVVTYWKKFSFTVTDYPIVSIGIICEKDKEKIKKIRIVAIGLTLLPQRFVNAEKILQDNKIDEKRILSVVDNIVQEVKVSNDIRVSVEYKKEILTVLIKEFLYKLLEENK